MRSYGNTIAGVEARRGTKLCVAASRLHNNMSFPFTVRNKCTGLRSNLLETAVLQFFTSREQKLCKYCWSFVLTPTFCGYGSCVLLHDGNVRLEL